MDVIDPSRSEQPRLYQELDSLRQSISSTVISWHPQSLIRSLYENRRQIIRAFLVEHQPFNIEAFLVIGELLLETNKNPPRGELQGAVEFETLVNRVRSMVRLEGLAEDMRTQRYIPVIEGGSHSAYRMLYSDAISDAYRSAGLASSYDTINLEAMFPFENLETMASLQLGADITDATSLLSDLFPLSIAMKKMVSLNWRTSQQYGYEPADIDMSVLFGWQQQIERNDATVTIPYERALSELNKHFDKWAKDSKTGNDFMSTFVTSTSRVPIPVKIGDDILMDRLTIAWFLIYLNGIVETPGTSDHYNASIGAYQTRFSGVFEDWVRKEVFSKGYTGPSVPIEKARDGSRFEFDIIACSPARAEVRLIEVKSHDMSPSSMTGTNLVNQELLGHEQLLDQAYRQQQRFEIFLDNRDLFERYIPVSMRDVQYHVRPYLITKIQPLMSQYCNVDIVQVEEFLNSILY